MNRNITRLARAIEGETTPAVARSAAPCALPVKAANANEPNAAEPVCKYWRREIRWDISVFLCFFSRYQPSDEIRRLRTGRDTMTPRLEPQA